MSDILLDPATGLFFVGFTYLASPYSHPDPEIRQWRYEAVVKVAARLMKQGEAIFCPIAHSHPISFALESGDNTHEFWMRQDIAILKHASRLKVLMLDGWNESRGVRQEIEVAGHSHIPAVYLTYE